MADFIAGNHGWNNLVNHMSKIWDEDWFYRDGSEDTESVELYDLFLEDFYNYLETNTDANIGEYANKEFDIQYYFDQYMNDNPCEAITQLYERVHDWLQNEEDFAASEDYLDSLYRRDAHATDIEFYANSEDIKENARKVFKEQRWTQEDLTHGFKNPEDLATAVQKVVDENDVEDIEAYDAGGMGYHETDIKGEWFETGCQFLGNGEEEWQMQCGVPFSKENDYGDCYRDFTINGDCIYVISDRLYVYGVKWSDVVEAGKELGLINAPVTSSRKSVKSAWARKAVQQLKEDDIPRF